MPAGLRAGHTTLGTLPALASLALTLLDTLDALAAENLEADDRQRAFALALVRWTRDECDAGALAAAGRALDREGWKVLSEAERATPWARACHAANALMSWRAQCMKYPTHTRQAIPLCALRIVAVWQALGEPEDAARARVGNLYAAHHLALTGREPGVSPTDPAAMEGVERFANLRRFWT